MPADRRDHVAVFEIADHYRLLATLQSPSNRDQQANKRVEPILIRLGGFLDVPQRSKPFGHASRHRGDPPLWLRHRQRRANLHYEKSSGDRDCNVGQAFCHKTYLRSKEGPAPERLPSRIAPFSRSGQFGVLRSLQALEEAPDWRVVAEHADLGAIGRLNSATNPRYDGSRDLIHGPHAACIKDDRRLVERNQRRLIVAVHRPDECERLGESDKLRRLEIGNRWPSNDAAQMAPGALALSIHAELKPTNKTAAALPSPFC